MSKRNRTLIIIYSALGVLILSLIALTQSGCAGTPRLQPTDASVSLGGAFQSVWGHTESAEYDTQQAKQFIKTETGLHFIDAASQEHGAVFKNLTIGMQAYETVNQQYAVVTRENMEARYKLAAYHDQWIGDRTKRWFWAIVGIWAGIGTIAMLVGGFFPTGIIGAIAGGVLRFLPVANLFTRGRDIIRAKQSGGLVTISRNVFGNKV